MFHDTNTPRLRVSPLARHRARDWHIDLAGIAGTGPKGRIVLADVKAGRDRPVTAETQPAPRPTSIAVYAASGSTAAVKSLLDDFSKAGAAIAFEALVLRLVAVAADDCGLREGGAAKIQFERTDGPLACLDMAQRTIGAITRFLAEEDHSGFDDREIDLSVRIDRDTGLTPMLVPLWPGVARRLIVSIDEAAGSYNCLLVYADGLSEAECNLLAALREYLNNPLGGIC
ncbi:E3 binding domain-containing protein [Hoeflea sp. Naph1]|uniref:E3 binding domain-containing protein n=1 Tax=Hoeflea sp. Naph1 TaxID=3388653 RepID=UPI0039902BC5